MCLRHPPYWNHRESRNQVHREFFLPPRTAYHWYWRWYRSPINGRYSRLFTYLRTSSSPSDLKWPNLSLKALIRELNPMLRDWGYLLLQRVMVLFDHGCLSVTATVRVDQEEISKVVCLELVRCFFKHPPNCKRKRWTDKIPIFLLGEIHVQPNPVFTSFRLQFF